MKNKLTLLTATHDPKIIEGDDMAQVWRKAGKYCKSKALEIISRINDEDIYICRALHDSIEFCTIDSDDAIIQSLQIPKSLTEDERKKRLSAYLFQYGFEVSFIGSDNICIAIPLSAESRRNYLIDSEPQGKICTKEKTIEMALARYRDHLSPNRPGDR